MLYTILIPNEECNMSKKTLNDAWQHYASVKDQSHGTAHIQSVLNNAMELAKKYPSVNKRDVEYAAILHDIGHQAQTGASGYHPIIGVGIAAKYLKDFPVESQTAILDAVRHHHGEELPHTDVGRIVRDADRLASTENPATLANRAFLYRVNKSPNQDVDTTARSAYKYLRTTKLNRLIGRANNAFLTEEGRQMFDNNVKNINDATSSYEKFTKLLDVKGVNPVYTKTAGVANYLKRYANNLKGRSSEIGMLRRNERTYADLADKAMKNGEKIKSSDYAIASLRSGTDAMLIGDAVSDARFGTAIGALVGMPISATAYQHFHNKEKTAGTLDYLASITKNDNATTVTVRHDNNIFQDAKNAYNDFGKEDGFRNDRLKVLAGTAAAALGASVMIYGALKGSPEFIRAGKAAIKTPFAERAARRAGPIMMAGGLYAAYAHKDDNDTTARNISLGLAGAGTAITATLGSSATSKLMANKALQKAAPVAAVGAGLIGAGLLASTHAAQRIEDEGKIQEYLKSKEPVVDITRHVNAIREKKNLASRYPLARVFNTVPIAENLPNMVVGTPSEELSPLDKALYNKYQQ